MKYQIKLLENWRPKFEFWTPGIYRVPEDFSEEKVALINVKFRKITKKAPAPENKLLEVPENKADGLKKTGAEKPLSSRRAGRLKIKTT